MVSKQQKQRSFKVKKKTTTTTKYWICTNNGCSANIHTTISALEYLDGLSFVMAKKSNIKICLNHLYVIFDKTLALIRTIKLILYYPSSCKTFIVDFHIDVIFSTFLRSTILLQGNNPVHNVPKVRIFSRYMIIC